MKKQPFKLTADWQSRLITVHPMITANTRQVEATYTLTHFSVLEAIGIVYREIRSSCSTCAVLQHKTISPNCWSKICQDAKIYGSKKSTSMQLFITALKPYTESGPVRDCSSKCRPGWYLRC